MTTIVIDPPSVEILTLDECKTALAISDSSQDAVITMAIGAATDALDASTSGWLGRAIREQTMELQLPCFEVGWSCRPRHYDCHWQAIALDFPPLIDIVSVKYLDPSGVDQTLVENADFRVLRRGAVDGKQLVEPAYGKLWPQARTDAGSIRIRYECGYDGDENIMPRQLRSAIILGVRSLLTAAARDPMLFEDRVEGVGSKRYQADATAVQIVTNAVDALLGGGGLRIW